MFAPTLPGHLGGPQITFEGGSNIQPLVDLLEGMFDEVGFDRPDVVGNSLGGWAALELARRGRARTVIALGPIGMHTVAQARAIERRLMLLYRLARLARPLGHLALRTPPTRRVLMRDVAVRGDNVPHQLARHLLNAVAGCNLPAMSARFRDADGTWPTIEYPEQITVPVLLLWGSRDRLVTRDQMERYLAALSNAQLVELTGSSHCPQLDDPNRVAKEILTFSRSNGAA